MIGRAGAATLLILAALSAPAAIPVSALQVRADQRVENRMLRQASTQEARGDLEEAEATLRELLELQPSSTSAVFALERVLRTDGRLTGIFAMFDHYLAEHPSAHQVWERKVGVLIEVDSLAALEPTVQNWIRAAHGSPDPYRAGARALEGVAGAGRAAELIEEGLAALGDLPVLLIDLGDMRLAGGRPGEAAEAWARALGRDRARTGDVFRRIEELGDERGEVAARIVAALGAGPTTVSRLEAGAELALREDLGDEARRLARAVRSRAGEREARGFLNGFARKAEDLERHESALWAYLQIREMTDDRAETRTTDERLAAAALVIGDTATALAAARRITESHGRGSAERQAAWTDELRILVESPDTDAAMQALVTFKEEYPAAPGLDALSAVLASRLLGKGMREEAMEVLSGIEGPGAALERAFLLLEGGAVPEGIVALQAAFPELEPTDATEILELTLALSELTSVGAGLAIEASIARHRGHPERGVAAVLERVDQVPASDRPAILALGARVADEAGLAGEATALRRRIVTEHQDSREFPEAAVRFARAVAAEPGGRDEAIRILEALIVGHPDNPVVPGARRELRRIRTSGAATGRGAP